LSTKNLDRFKNGDRVIVDYPIGGSSYLKTYTGNRGIIKSTDGDGFPYVEFEDGNGLWVEDKFLKLSLKELFEEDI